MHLDSRQVLIAEVIFGLVAWALIARTFWWPRIVALSRHDALRAVIAPQMFRIVGMSLLADNIAAPGLDPNFASTVATGDAITAVLAVAAFIALGRRPRLGVVLAWLTTLVGAADLVRNLAVGARINAAQYLGAGWFVVALAVPLMFVAHVAAARLLLRRLDRTALGAGVGEPTGARAVAIDPHDA